MWAAARGLSARRCLAREAVRDRRLARPLRRARRARAARSGSLGVERSISAPMAARCSPTAEADVQRCLLHDTAVRRAGVDPFRDTRVTVFGSGIWNVDEVGAVIAVATTHSIQNGIADASV